MNYKDTTSKMTKLSVLTFLLLSCTFAKSTIKLDSYYDRDRISKF